MGQQPDDFGQRVVRAIRWADREVRGWLTRQEIQGRGPAWWRAVIGALLVGLLAGAGVKGCNESREVARAEAALRETFLQRQAELTAQNIALKQNVSELEERAADALGVVNELREAVLEEQAAVEVGLTTRIAVREHLTLRSYEMEDRPGDDEPKAWWSFKRPGLGEQAVNYAVSVSFDGEALRSITLVASTQHEVTAEERAVVWDKCVDDLHGVFPGARESLNSAVDSLALPTARDGAGRTGYGAGRAGWEVSVFQSRPSTTRKADLFRIIARRAWRD